MIELPPTLSLGATAVYTSCCSADVSWDLQVFAAIGKRTLSVPVTGLVDNIWYDSYLGHFSATGKVLSFISQPGTTKLFIPETPAAQGGIEPVDMPPKQMGNYLKSCLRESIATFCQQRDLCLPVTIAINDTSLAAVVCTVLLSTIYENVSVKVSIEIPSTWKRLLENLGTQITDNKVSIFVSELTKLVYQNQCMAIAQDINKHGAIIPRSLLTGKL